MTNTILNRRGVPAGLFVSDPRTAEALVYPDNIEVMEA